MWTAQGTLTCFKLLRPSVNIPPNNEMKREMTLPGLPVHPQPLLCLHMLFFSSATRGYP